MEIWFFSMHNKEEAAGCNKKLEMPQKEKDIYKNLSQWGKLLLMDEEKNYLLQHNYLCSKKMPKPSSWLSVVAIQKVATTQTRCKWRKAGGRQPCIKHQQAIKAFNPKQSDKDEG